MIVKSAETRPGNLLKPRQLKVSKDLTFSVRIRNPNHGLFGLRIILHKFYAQKDQLSERDWVFIEYLRLYIQDYENAKGLLVTQKWLASKQLLKLLITFRSLDKFEYWAFAQFSILRKHIMTRRAFLSIDSNLRDFFKFSNRRLRVDPPPLRYIGVGYRDKGTAKDITIDGSPSWQEVASKTNSYETIRLPTEPIGIISPIRLQLKQ